MKKLVAIGILILALCSGGMAQNTKSYTPVNMYMLNPLLVNPAYSGTRESMSFTGMIGANWLDIPNAQIQNWNAAGLMYSATADFPLSEKNAVGALIVNSKFGVNRNTAFYGHYAYRIITGAGKLSFGLRAGFNSYNRDLQMASFRDQGDPVQSYDYSMIYPNFGAGVYWYSDDYYAGLSVPDFFFPPIGSEAFDAHPKNYMYTLMGGYLYRISEDFKIKPSTMLTYSLNAPLVYQVNLSFIMFQDMVWLGAGYKSNGIVAMLEIQAASAVRIGYAWEFPTGGIRQYAPWGSHEFLLRFDTSFKLRTVSPAYFW
jgi:type IX secretion system PorP/SprF family membrane protein